MTDAGLFALFLAVGLAVLTIGAAICDVLDNRERRDARNRNHARKIR